MTEDPMDTPFEEEFHDETPPQEPEPRHTRRRGGEWMAGAVLILIGLIFLLQNVMGSMPVLDNWWALFILIPAVGSFSTAWQSYQRHGRLNSGARSSLIAGIAMVIVSAILLFGLDWGTWWPVFLILAGIGALLSGVFRR
ncbi:MAG: hypothetical protein JXB35_06570 [Anaerolineae bacterium]|nr:hypothetical protein [Anaerolineae bacterium]